MSKMLIAGMRMKLPRKTKKAVFNGKSMGSLGRMELRRVFRYMNFVARERGISREAGIY